jgi:hypothetical protein
MNGPIRVMSGPIRVGDTVKVGEGDYRLMPFLWANGGLLEEGRLSSCGARVPREDRRHRVRAGAVRGAMGRRDVGRLG